MSTGDPPKISPCVFCQSNFNRGMFSDHIFEENHIHLCFRCKLCEKHVTDKAPIFVYLKDLIHHQDEMHGGSYHWQCILPEKSHQMRCLLCRQLFLGRPERSMEIHLLLEHDRPIPPDSSLDHDNLVAFGCRICDYETKSFDEWSNHFSSFTQTKSFCPVGIPAIKRKTSLEGKEARNKDKKNKGDPFLQEVTETAKILLKAKKLRLSNMRACSERICDTDSLETVSSQGSDFEEVKELKREIKKVKEEDAKEERRKSRERTSSPSLIPQRRSSISVHSDDNLVWCYDCDRGIECLSATDWVKHVRGSEHKKQAKKDADIHSKAAPTSTPTTSRKKSVDVITLDDIEDGEIREEEEEQIRIKTEPGTDRKGIDAEVQESWKILQKARKLRLANMRKQKALDTWTRKVSECSETNLVQEKMEKVNFKIRNEPSKAIHNVFEIPKEGLTKLRPEFSSSVQDVPDSDSSPAQREQPSTPKRGTKRRITLLQKPVELEGLSPQSVHPTPPSLIQGLAPKPPFRAEQSQAYGMPQAPAYGGPQMNPPEVHATNAYGTPSPAYVAAQTPAYGVAKSPAYGVAQSPAYPVAQSPAYPVAQAVAQVDPGSQLPGGQDDPGEIPMPKEDLP